MTERIETRVVAYVLVRNDKDEILLLQRSGTGYLDDYWDLPSGHLEEGETIRDTAVRELSEEAGLTVLAEDMRLIHVDQFDVDVRYTNFTFLATEWSGEPRIGEPDKCKATGWFRLHELPELCTNGVRVNEAADFSDDITYSLTTHQNYDALIAPKVS